MFLMDYKILLKYSFHSILIRKQDYNIRQTEDEDVSFDYAFDIEGNSSLHDVSNDYGLALYLFNSFIRHKKEDVVQIAVMKNEKGKTALDLASDRNNLKVLQLFF
jgi:hypothetical protein